MILIPSKRFERVYKDAREIWHYQQYLFTEEYYTRAPFIPPFSLFYDIYRMCRRIVFAVRHKLQNTPNDYRLAVFSK